MVARASRRPQRVSAGRSRRRSPRFQWCSAVARRGTACRYQRRCRRRLYHSHAEDQRGPVQRHQWSEKSARHGCSRRRVQSHSAAPSVRSVHECSGSARVRVRALCVSRGSTHRQARTATRVHHREQCPNSTSWCPTAARCCEQKFSPSKFGCRPTHNYTGSSQGCGDPIPARDESDHSLCCKMGPANPMSNTLPNCIILGDSVLIG